jgi:shikimate kinase
VVLVGMMGSGKSTVGRAVAARLGATFIDSDEQVERATGRTVREIFETDGEAAFRKVESEALTAALESDERAVIAAAGGAVLDRANRARLRDAGAVVWLRARPDVLAGRVLTAAHRPLLGDDPLSVLRRLDGERAPLYRDVASTVVDVDVLDVDAVVDRVLEAVRA